MPELVSLLGASLSKKASGAPLADTLRRLHEAAASGHAHTERALEDITKTIYRNETFSTAFPEEIGDAYRLACEMGQP